MIWKNLYVPIVKNRGRHLRERLLHEDAIYHTFNRKLYSFKLKNKFLMHDILNILKKIQWCHVQQRQKVFLLIDPKLLVHREILWNNVVSPTCTEIRFH